MHHITSHHVTLSQPMGHPRRCLFAGHALMHALHVLCSPALVEWPLCAALCAQPGCLQGRTAVLVAHRLSTAAACDQASVMHACMHPLLGQSGGPRPHAAEGCSRPLRPQRPTHKGCTVQAAHGAGWIAPHPAACMHVRGPGADAHTCVHLGVCCVVFCFVSLSVTPNLTALPIIPHCF